MTIKHLILFIVALVSLAFACIWYYYEPGFDSLLTLFGTLSGTLLILFEKRIRLGLRLKKLLLKNPKISPDIKLVAFDADGVLMVNKHFMYSWQSVWEYFGLPEKDRKELLHKYRDLQVITYPEWCKECEEIFKKNNLVYDDFEIITSNVKQIKNLELAITELKNRGIKTAIISGGIDVFLAYVIPNYENLFDFVYINKMTFDANKRLKDIIPTPFDFRKKFDALVEIGNENKIRLDQMAFVGEGMNDFDAMLAMKDKGVTVFSIKPHDIRIHEIAYIVNSYDLMKVVKPIIKEP